MVADAPPFERITDRVARHTGGLAVIGHFIRFDIAILRAEMRRCGLDWRPAVSLDVMLLYAGLFPDRPSLRLDDIAAALEVPVVGRHSALGDALTAGEIFLRLVPEMAARGIDTLGAALALQQQAAQRLGVASDAAHALSTP